MGNGAGAFLWGALIVFIIISIAIEFPLIRWFLVIGLIVVIYQVYIGIKEQNKKDEIEAQTEREKNKLIDELPNEFQDIIEKNIKIVASAYRRSVTSNAFGKKNYEKFSPQLEEYIRDNSKLIKRLDEEYYTDIDFNISDLIKFIELKLEKLDKDLNYSDDMDPYEYEHFCANEFKKNGWDANATQGSSDQGVDVIAYKDGVTLVGQCKKYKRAVGNKAVQEVVAGIKFYDASIGIVIAPNGFTKSANALAEANDIKLIHHSEIKNIN